MPNAMESFMRSGVENRMRALAETALRDNDGVVTREAFSEVVESARGWGLWDYERSALLQPETYLNRWFSGDEMARLTFAPDAMSLANEVAGDSGVEVHLRAASASQPTDAVEAPAEGSIREAFEAAMARGKELGAMKDWSVKTAGAELKFTTTGAGRTWPGLVIDAPTFTDPAPKKVLEARAEELGSIKTIEEFTAFVDKVLAEENDYLKADGVEAKTVNETFGIRNVRRLALVEELKASLGSTGLSGEARAEAKGVITGASIKLVTGENYDMKVGSHTNYWPYWRNYLPPLEKMLGQEVSGSDADKQLRNRLADIYRRKTATKRSITERDFEKSLGLALVHRPLYSEGTGHRVSMVEGSTPFKPEYELLTVASEALPEGFEKYAGMQVVRDTDGTLRFDYMGEGDDATSVLAKENAGKAIPAELNALISSKALGRSDLSDLTMRRFVGGESPRSDFSCDWDGNGQINVAQINIGWWGHCHNEAPLNAMDVDPNKAVTLYRAERGVDADKALVTYSSTDAWDITGAFTSDHEGGFADASTGMATRVDNTSFVGERNNGKHTLGLVLPTGGSVSVNAELSSISTAEGESLKAKSIFRENVENEDGTFAPNPRYVSTAADEVDLLTVDVTGHTMRLSAEYFTLDKSGYPAKKTQSISLDPSKDEFVKVSEEIVQRDTIGGTTRQHFYNAKTNEYYSTLSEVKSDNGFEPVVKETADKVVVEKLTHTSETEYDSAKELFEHFMERPGLPKTYDTSSGKAVWNYPVNREQLDLVREEKRVEDGQTYTYRTMRLKYDTMGGPSGDSSFILKFSATGKIVDVCALDPMPDFAFRNEHWVCAPVTTDVRGRPAFNIKAMNKGYLLRENGRGFGDVETGMWSRMATVLYGALTDETAEGHAYLFEKLDGSIVSFDSKESFDAAVEADKQLREEASAE